MSNRGDALPMMIDKIPTLAWSRRPDGTTVRVNVTIIQLISLTLFFVATGLLHERSGPAFLTALTAFLIFALVAWLRALSIILVPGAPDAPNPRRPD